MMTQAHDRAETSTPAASVLQFAAADHPLVSVVIPAYNAEDYIERTLTSVRAQTYKNIEVLVVDDGSTDRTAALVEGIARSDSRVVLLRQANAGTAVARNLAIRHAKGEFIAPLDADDIWYPRNLEKQVQTFLMSDASVGVVYSWSLDIDESDRPQGGFHACTVEGNVYLTLVSHYFLGNSSSGLIRRGCLDKVGGFNTSMRASGAQGCEDWDLYLRIAECYEFRAVPEFMVGYRKTRDSLTRDYSSMANSHNLVLEFARQRNPNLSPLLCRLSRSGFLLYLAYQSDHAGDFRSTFRWLRKAIQSDPVTSWLRFGLYRLMLSGSLQAIRQSPGTPTQETTVHRHRPAERGSGATSVQSRFSVIQRRVAIRIIDGIANLFQRLAPILFRSSQIAR